MADTANPTLDRTPTLAEIFAQNNAQYLGRSGMNKSGENYRGVGNTGALVTGTFGTPAHKVGLASLLKRLLTEGRVDPRLLAAAQSRNARATQSQVDAARGGAAASGASGSGLAMAMRDAISGAGANRAANLDYQDISDSYDRQSQNLGLLDQLVIQPQLGYAGLGLQDAAEQRKQKAAKLNAFGSIAGSAAKAFVS